MPLKGTLAWGMTSECGLYMGSIMHVKDSMGTGKMRSTFVGAENINLS